MDVYIYIFKSISKLEKELFGIIWYLNRPHF